MDDQSIALGVTQVSYVADEILVERTAHGDVGAFEELIVRYQTPAVHFAFRFVGDAQEAEDLAQEAFLRVFRNAHNYNYTARFRTWFFQILINLCRDWLKKKKPVLIGDALELVLSNSDPSEVLDRERRTKALARALQSLPPNQRLALILCHYEGMNYQEASAVLGVSNKALDSLLVRARRTLRVRLWNLR